MSTALRLRSRGCSQIEIGFGHYSILEKDTKKIPMLGAPLDHIPKTYIYDRIRL